MATIILDKSNAALLVVRESKINMSFITIIVFNIGMWLFTFVSFNNN